MSIWSGIRRSGHDGSLDVEITAVDLDDRSRVDGYSGEGPRDLEIDVAIAPSWNGLVRLSITSSPEGNRPDLDVCAGLDPDVVDALILQLAVARHEVGARRRGLPPAS